MRDEVLKSGWAALRGLEGGVWGLPGRMGCWGLTRLCEDGSQHGFSRGKSCLTILVAFCGGTSGLMDEVVRGRTVTDVICLNL